MTTYEVEIREVYDPDTEQKYRALYFDGALFDWGMDPVELHRAKSFCDNDPFLKKSTHGDICRYFLQCLSEVFEREVTLKELNTAIKQGHIDQ
jgi:hypothetical protein